MLKKLNSERNSDHQLKRRIFIGIAILLFLILSYSWYGGDNKISNIEDRNMTANLKYISVNNSAIMRRIYCENLNNYNEDAFQKYCQH